MNLATIDPDLLSEALDAARRALRRMDDKHIPARLRDIAGRSGRLPAPLAKRLLAELDGSEWLRAEALAEMVVDFDDNSPDNSPGKSASVLFLERPEDWVDRIEIIAAGHRQAGDRSEIKRLESELRVAVARASKLERRLAIAERKEHQARTDVDERLAEAVAPHRRSQARLEAARDQLASRLLSAEQEVTRLAAENSHLRQKVEDSRASRGKATPTAPPNRTRAAWSLNKATDLARHLDDINRAFVVAPAPSDGSETVPEATPIPGPPAGIRPDQAEAIVWLLGLPGPVNVAIDGWNAAHLLKSPPVAATRDRIIEAARRIILASSGKRVVTAVFDSSQVGESFSADEVIVRFVGSADEELIAMANNDATRMVVITSDRRVREAAEKAGAIGLWSEALTDWLRTGGRRTFKA